MYAIKFSEFTSRQKWHTNINGLTVHDSMLQKVLVTAAQSISCIQQINTISTRCDDDDQTTPELQRISSAAAWHGRAIITRRNQS